MRTVLDAEPPNHTRRAAPWSLHSPSGVTEIELCPSRSLATLRGTPFSSHVVEALCLNCEAARRFQGRFRVRGSPSVRRRKNTVNGRKRRLRLHKWLNNRWGIAIPPSIAEAQTTAPRPSP